MSREHPPAISRNMTDADREAEVLHTPHDSVTHTRGWGDSGYRVEVVEHDCPVCSFDRMVRRIDISPEFPPTVEAWCLNPNCAHFVSDELSYATHGNYPQRVVREPAVME